MSLRHNISPTDAVLDKELLLTQFHP